MRKRLQSIYSKITLRDKILILNVLIIVSVLTVLGYFATNISSGIIIDTTEKSAGRELELIDFNLHTLLNSIEDYSKVVATNNNVQSMLRALTDVTAADKQSGGHIDVVSMRPEMYNAVAPIISPNTQIFAVSVFLNNQVIYSDSMIDHASIPTLISEEFLEKAQQLQKPVWSDLMRMKLNDGRYAHVIAVAKLVIDLNKGDNIGVVILFIDEKQISRIFSANKGSRVNKRFVLKKDGQIISAEDQTDLNRHLADVIQIDERQYERLLADKKVVLNRNGESYLLSLQEVDKMDWNIASFESMEEINRDNERIRQFILITGALCVFIAVVSSYYISNTVTKPIQRLARIMIQVRKGDMNVRAEHVNSQEIGLLTHGFNNLMNRVEQLLEDNVNEQKLKQSYELKLIQSQMNPHFLYNSLETIISLNKLEHYNEAIQVTRTLAEFYRLSLSKGKDIITVGDEIKIIDHYLKIQNSRYSDYMDYSIIVSEDILGYAMPKLTLQPLVENSIYHGLKFKGNKGKLEIHGRFQEGCILLTVSDNGVGMSDEKAAALMQQHELEEGKPFSFGIRSVDRRIKLLFGNEYGLHIMSERGHYTKVTVKIPALLLEGETNVKANDRR